MTDLAKLSFDDDEKIISAQPKVLKQHDAKLKGKKGIVRSIWLGVTWCLTFYIPNFALAHIGKMRQPAVQMAWREKFALNLIIYISCAGLLFFIIGIPLILCPNKHILSDYEIETKKTLAKPYVSAYGIYYAIPSIVDDHVNTKRYLNGKAMESTTLGRDVSAMFVKTDAWDQYCPGLTKPPSGWDNIKREIPEDSMTVWNIHQDKTKSGKQKDYLALIKNYRKGSVARDSNWILQFFEQDPANNYLFVAYDKVYDMTAYMNPVQKVSFLGRNVGQILSSQGQTGKDVTSLLEQIKNVESPADWAKYMNCMEAMFMVGVVDHRKDASCIASDYIVLTGSIFLVVIIGFKFLAALQFGAISTPEVQESFVICCVPCFTEGTESIRNTIDSLAASDYDNQRKLLFIVADGMIKGAGNDKYTPDIVLSILGHSRIIEPPPRSYQALGEGIVQLNMSKTYSGHYSLNGTLVPYIVVVKIGDFTERIKPGNRGKRDSQMILMQYLSRVHTSSDLNPTELELQYHFTYSIKVDPRNYEYLLWVDGDTEIFPDSISKFVSLFSSDVNLAGICGETLLRNENDSWVTMIQVYEYFVSHHLAKAFESLFGTVTCLPGCFSIYRIWSTTESCPILVSPKIIQDYGENNIDTLHLKNLLSLGEDRYLTTLMLKNFPKYKLKFMADAKARTSAPEKWAVLLSQRRRWINSTVHNLLELLLLDEMCGFFIFSIRFVIFMDLFGTVMAPAGFLYVIWLVVSLITDDTIQIPLVSLIMVCAVYGLQVIIFVLKREWQHIAMPLYAFFLPLYAFWHFDDFSWGFTRRVDVDDHNNPRIIIGSEEKFTANMVPRKSWAQYMENDLDWRQEIDNKTF